MNRFERTHAELMKQLEMLGMTKEKAEMSNDSNDGEMSKEIEEGRPETEDNRSGKLN